MKQNSYCWASLALVVIGILIYRNRSEAMEGFHDQPTTPRAVDNTFCDEVGAYDPVCPTHVLEDNCLWSSRGQVNVGYLCAVAGDQTQTFQFV